MLSLPLAFLLSLLSIVIIEKTKRKKIHDFAFIILLIPAWYIAMSLGIAMCILTDESLGFSLDRWYINLFFEWISFSRINKFPEETYSVRLLGWLIGFHIAFIFMFLPRSSLARKKEAKEFIEKLSCFIIGLLLSLIHI